MCYSATSSIISATVGIIGSILCISLGSITDRIVGYYIAFVCSMQIIEYLLWTHQICDNYNRMISVIGMILNHVQPFVLGLIILAINNKSPKHWVLIIMFLYMCVIIPYSIQFINVSEKCTIKSSDNPHLFWKWNYMNYAIFVYFVFIVTLCALFILGIPNLKNGILLSAVAIITYSLSLVFYPKNAAGSIWCYFSTFLPIMYYVGRVG